MTAAVNRTADCTAFTVFPILAVDDFIRLGMGADTPQVLGFDLRIVVKCLHGTHSFLHQIRTFVTMYAIMPNQNRSCPNPRAGAFK